MLLNWKKSESGSYPVRIDMESSKRNVYIRVNPIKVGALWQYDEAIIQRNVFNENVSAITDEITEKENSIEEAIRIIVASVTFDDRPIAEKEGFRLVRRYDPVDHRIMWEYEPDPNYVSNENGSYLHPFTYVDGMTVEVGKWYTDGSDIWEALKAGVPAEWEDPEYFDVIF